MEQKLVFPVGDGFHMVYVDTPQGRVLQPKTITAKSPTELATLQRLGWKVRE